MPEALLPVMRGEKKEMLLAGGIVVQDVRPSLEKVTQDSRLWQLLRTPILMRLDMVSRTDEEVDDTIIGGGEVEVQLMICFCMAVSMGSQKNRSDHKPKPNRLLCFNLS